MTIKSLIQTGLILAALTATGHSATAQTSTPRPLYLAGTVICPDGTPLDHAGEAPSDLLMQLLCAAAPTGADQTRQDVSAGVQKAEADKRAHAALQGHFGVWEALKASWEQRRLDYLQDVAMSHLLWIFYALAFLCWILLSGRSRNGRS